MRSVAHPDWAKNAVMYEVNIRQYTPAGTFNAFATSLPRLKDMGVDVLSIMPVQPTGKANRKGSLGNPYALADYRAINPEFGTITDFNAMVDAAHQLGMKVLLDWVANHTAFDHPWTREHKNYYTLKSDGSISRALDDRGRETDWTDLADLNYSNAALRTAMIGEMTWWLDNTRIDGFRAAVAGFVPKEFWQTVSNTFRAQRSDVLLVAEWDDPRLHSAFDVTYNWELFHLLNDVALGKKGAKDISADVAVQQKAFGDSAFRLSFTSNHDENSENGTEFERMGENHVPAFVLSATMQGTMPFLYGGQEVSVRKRLKPYDKDVIDWNGPTLAPFYTKIFALKHQERALWNGEWGGRQSDIKTSSGNDRVYAFSRTAFPSTVAVFVNFGGAEANIAYSELPSPGKYIDWMTGADESMAESGTVTIPPHGFRIFVRANTESN